MDGNSLKIIRAFYCEYKTLLVDRFFPVDRNFIVDPRCDCYDLRLIIINHLNDSIRLEITSVNIN